MGCASGRGLQTHHEGSRGIENWKLAPHYQSMFRFAVDRHILDEVNGVSPTGGQSEWDEFWRAWMRGISDHPFLDENVEYIVVRRRRAGLPELQEMNRTSIDKVIEQEMAKEKAPSSYSGWNEYWKNRILKLRETPILPDDSNYIVQRRKILGLVE